MGWASRQSAHFFSLAQTPRLLMNRSDQFWKSVNTLATAYLQGKLEPLDCASCAVGNLVAAELGGASVAGWVDEWPVHSTSPQGNWRDAIRSNEVWQPRKAAAVLNADATRFVTPIFIDIDMSVVQTVSVTDYSVTDVGYDPATPLPYTPIEFFRIESAFLHGLDGRDQSTFESLMDAVEVLFDIHNVEDEDLKSEAKEAFDGDYNTVDAVLT
jgi:hypothetical protein